MAHLIRGLSEAGTVDVVSADSTRGDTAPPDGLIARTIRVPWGPAVGPRSWVREWATARSDRRLPRRMLKGRLVPLSNAVADLLTDSTYDVVWFEHVDVWAATADIVAARCPNAVTICDFDNLENLALRARRSVGPAWSRPGGRPRTRADVGIAVRWITSRIADLDDERRFDRLQRRVAAAVDRVVVCSPLDVKRSRCPNAICVPNGFEVADRLAERIDGPRRPPTFTFIGLMSYGPNTDAVTWFAREVFPAVRAGTGAEFRIVGRRADAVAALAACDGVTVVGEVPSVAPELDRADVVVIPIRFGAGTRLKAVEAMAHRRPIAATTIGVEGLGLTAGIDVEIGDDAASLAACCRHLLDSDHWTSVADAAELQYRKCFEWSRIRAELASTVRELVESSSSTG